MGKYTFKSDLSVKGIKNLQKELLNYQNKFNEKVNLFIEKLALEGVILAKTKIAEKDAVYTGELYKSMNLKKGDAIFNGSSWIIYTDCPWASFVEFGTGIVGMQNPHPDTSIIGWKYDVNEHGEKGWFYFKDGEWHWTKGMPSRPFLFETALELQTIVPKIAKEIFR